MKRWQLSVNVIAPVDNNVKIIKRPSADIETTKQKHFFSLWPTYPKRDIMIFVRITKEELRPGCRVLEELVKS